MNTAFAAPPAGTRTLSPRVTSCLSDVSGEIVTAGVDKPVTGPETEVGEQPTTSPSSSQNCESVLTVDPDGNDDNRVEVVNCVAPVTLETTMTSLLPPPSRRSFSFLKKKDVDPTLMVTVVPAVAGDVSVVDVGTTEIVAPDGRSAYTST